MGSNYTAISCGDELRGEHRMETLQTRSAPSGMMSESWGQAGRGPRAFIQRLGSHTGLPCVISGTHAKFWGSNE
jgi:hypothetical protein